MEQSTLDPSSADWYPVYAGELHHAGLWYISHSLVTLEAANRGKTKQKNNKARGEGGKKMQKSCRLIQLIVSM